MLWEHEPQASVSTGFTSSPKPSRETRWNDHLLNAYAVTVDLLLRARNRKAKLNVAVLSI